MDDAATLIEHMRLGEIMAEMPAPWPALRAACAVLRKEGLGVRLVARNLLIHASATSLQPHMMAAIQIDDAGNEAVFDGRGHQGWADIAGAWAERVGHGDGYLDIDKGILDPPPRVIGQPGPEDGSIGQQLERNLAEYRTRVLEANTKRVVTSNGRAPRL